MITILSFLVLEGKLSYFNACLQLLFRLCFKSTVIQCNEVVVCEAFTDQKVIKCNADSGQISLSRFT